MTSNEQANFAPNLKGYSGQQPFRFWCQTVLPLVYDDSLSYYELLNKVVYYLNNVISDVSNMEENVSGLNDAYIKLENYVNVYFDSLDIQEEINNKLDEMAKDGTLTELITPLLPAIVGKWLEDNITPTSPPVDKTLKVEGAAADAKVVGEKFDESFQLHSISVGTDINTLTNQGYSILTYSGMYPNQPFEPGRRRIIITYTNPTSYLMQIAYSSDKQYATRAYADGNWEQWVYPLNDFKQFMVDTFVYRNSSGITDLNDAYQPGWYLLTFNYNYQNAPSNKTGRKLLISYTNGNSTTAFLHQLYIDSTNKSIFMRTKTGGQGGEWENWIEITEKPDIPELNNQFIVRTLSTGTDINTLTEAGFCLLSYSGNYPNQPFDSGRRRVIITYPNSSNSNLIQVAYTSANGEYATRAFADNAWSNWIYPLANINNFIADAFNYRLAEGISDLNDLYSPGWYNLGYTTNYNNAPNNATGRKLLLVYSASNMQTAFLHQVYINSTTGYIYMRTKTGGSGGQWESWKSLNENINVTPIGSQFVLRALTAGADINTLKEPGFYLLGYSGNYPNQPFDSGRRRVIITYPNSSNSNLIQVAYTSANGEYATRAFADNAWSNWIYPIQTINENIEKAANPVVSKVLETTNYSSTETRQNIGQKIKVMSYNVANYDKNTGVFITEEKLSNIKKMLSKYTPDFIGTQEDRKYLDENNAVNTNNGLYRPVFPCIYGEYGVQIKSKYEGESNYISYSNGRSLVYELITINNKKLLICSTHLVARYNNGEVDSPESIAARLTQYTQMFRWLNGEISLESLNTNTQIMCPTWDWCVVCGDMNTITQDDKNNLQTLAQYNDFTMANGGWLGWINTSQSNNALDNIIVSKDIIINGITVPEYLADKLYSDHYPIIADLTLL